MTTLLPEQILGFPPVCEGCRMGEPRRPSRRHPRASHRQCRTTERNFSRPPKNHDLGRSITLCQPHRPLACATTVLAVPPPSHHGQATTTDGKRGENQGQEAVEERPCGREQPPLPPTVTDQRQLHERTMPLLTRPSPAGS
jgi:hypothetical protein